MRWLCVGVGLLVSGAGLAEHEQYEVVFEGRPAKRVVIGYTQEGSGWTVQEEVLDRGTSEEYLVRVVRDRRGNYFWASREMKPVAREESDGFVTYSAGSFGYVKTFREPLLDMVRQAVQAGTLEPGQEYMEHIPTILASVNYWGTRTDH